MKTSELTGVALDWAVAKAIGEYKPVAVPKYSSDWAQGGPIIEREKIYLNCLRKGDHSRTEIWEAWPYDSAKLVQQGPTPLIAAMRCYCCAKLGDEIDIPEELQPCQQPNL